MQEIPVCPQCQQPLTRNPTQVTYDREGYADVWIGPEWHCTSCGVDYYRDNKGVFYPSPSTHQFITNPKTLYDRSVKLSTDYEIKIDE